MQTYRYRAARSDGAVVSGLIDAPTSADVSATLIGRGLHPLSLSPAELGEGNRRAAGRRDLAIVFRSIAALVASGVPLERAVGSSAALARGALRDGLNAARAHLRQGWSLSQALGASRGVIPEVVVGMLRAGERGSQLTRALEQAATHLEQEAELVGRVRQALAYPLLLALAGMASVLLIGTVVVPKFAELLGDLGQELPPATRLLLEISGLLVRYWLVLLIGSIGGAWLLVEWGRRPAGRLACHGALLVIPGIGQVRHALATARFARALGCTLETGMPILSALQAAREACGDRAVAERLSRVHERVAQGNPLASALDSERALTPSATQLVAVGEASGRLAFLAARAGDLAGQEAERGLKLLVSLLEPALVIVLGGLVAFVAAALLQAVYSIRPGGA